MYETIQEHINELVNPIPYSQWLREHNKINNIPFTTAKYPFQKAILDDLHPNMDVIKPSQVGLTEIQIRKTLAMAYRNPNRTIIFSLPSDDMRDRLADTRVKPILTNNPVYQEGVTRETSRSKEIVQIKDSFVLFLPANEKSATSQAADAVMNDEIDLSNQKILALFNSRMQASDWRLNQRFSTPTFTGYGIDASFKLSDQQLYMYKCPHCNYYQHPEFTPEYVEFPNFPLQITDDFSQLENDWIEKYNLDFSLARVVCRKCRKPAQLGNAEYREWVATYPSRKNHRGYRVTPFALNNLNPEYILTELLKYKKNNFIRGWHNTVLGMPYKGGDDRLTESELKEIFTPQMGVQEYDPNYEYFLGYDVGSISYITVCRVNPERPLDTEYVLFETVKNINLKDRVKALVNKYNITYGLGDKYPEQTLATDIKEETDFTVIPVIYESNKSPRNTTPKEDEYGVLEHIQIQRTWHFDTFIGAIRNGFISISGFGVHKDIIIAHFTDMYREEKPESIPVWVKMTGNDHFLHSAAYCFRAKEVYFGDESNKPTAPSGLLFGGLDVNLYQTQNLFGGKKR